MTQKSSLPADRSAGSRSRGPRPSPPRADAGRDAHVTALHPESVATGFASSSTARRGGRCRRRRSSQRACASDAGSDRERARELRRARAAGRRRSTQPQRFARRDRSAAGLAAVLEAAGGREPRADEAVETLVAPRLRRRRTLRCSRAASLAARGYGTRRSASISTARGSTASRSRRPRRLEPERERAAAHRRTDVGSAAEDGAASGDQRVLRRVDRIGARRARTPDGLSQTAVS